MMRGEGPHLVDADGNATSTTSSPRPAPPRPRRAAVVRAVQDAAARGFSFGTPTEAESVLAHLVQEFVPSLEKLRFVSSGTEAVMSAVRVARAFTERPLLVTFDGNYHGHAPLTPAVTVPYNDLAPGRERVREVPGQDRRASRRAGRAATWASSRRRRVPRRAARAVRRSTARCCCSTR